MNVPARFRNLLLAAGLVAAVGCSSDDPKSPTAPPTTPVPPVTPVTYSVTVSPSKSALEVGTTDSLVLTVTAARTDTGAAPPNLTEVTLTTSLGAFGNTAGPQTLTAELISGQVQIAFFPGATVGTATIRAQVGSSVGFGSVRVVEDQAGTFFISSVSPNVGSPQGGESVDILGGGFDPPIRVTFGGVAATVRTSSSTRITVTTPPYLDGLDPGETAAVVVAVTINLNEDDQAQDSLASGFIYANGGGGGILQPTIFSLTPSSGPNEGGTQVTINGDGFEAPVQVKFGEGSGTDINGQEAQVLSVSRTRIVVLSPRTLVEGSSGHPLPNELSDVLVKNINTGRATVANAAFKYGNEVFITAIGPGEGPSTGGQQVTLYGQGFDEPVAVSLANVAQQVLSVSGSEIVVLTVPVQITNCQDQNGPSQVVNIETGDSATGPNYTYRVSASVKPIVTGVSPSAASQSGGASLTITGANFTSPMVVEFVVNGTSYSVVVSGVTSSTITVMSPQVSDTVMSTQPCDLDGDDTMGVQLVATSADVKVTAVNTGCTYLAQGIFTINPSSAACVGD